MILAVDQGTTGTTCLVVATALGAAALAGLAVGLWPDVGAVGALVRRGARYEPALSASERLRKREDWRHALHRAMGSP